MWVLSFALLCLVILLVSLIYIKLQIVIDLFDNDHKRTMNVALLPKILEYENIDLDKLNINYSKLWAWISRQKEQEYKSEIEESPDKKLLRSGFFQFHGKIHNYYKVLRVAIRYIIIDKFSWRTRVGLDDAMYTALAAGSIWAFKGSLLSFLSTRKQLKLFTIEVQPDFSSQILTTHLNCILKVRIGHIILVDIFLLVHRFRDRTISKTVDEFCYLTARYAKSAILHQVKEWGCISGAATGGKTKPSD